MRFSYIASKPIYNEQDKGRQEELKKLNETIGKYPEQGLFIFDESRFAHIQKLEETSLKGR